MRSPRSAASPLLLGSRLGARPVLAVMLLWRRARLRGRCTGSHAFAALAHARRFAIGVLLACAPSAQADEQPACDRCEDDREKRPSLGSPDLASEHRGCTKLNIDACRSTSPRIQPIRLASSINIVRDAVERFMRFQQLLGKLG
jgi:hypothetical protein